MYCFYIIFGDIEYLERFINFEIVFGYITGDGILIVLGMWNIGRGVFLKGRLFVLWEVVVKCLLVIVM